MKWIKEFKEFAIKGNMFDMAIGIIIGMAFSKIVSSLVNDIILPCLSLATGNVKFQNLTFVLQEEIMDKNGNVSQELLAIKYGEFIQVVLDFFLVAITVFIVVKVFNQLKRKAENVKDTSVSTPKDIELLTEIRDIMREKK